jgi:competence ComEA-like helix-hairpin-helix protein
MATGGERRILGFLVALALIGAGARAVGVQRFEQATLGSTSPLQAAGAARALAAQRAAVDSARQAPRTSRSRSTKPKSQSTGEGGETRAGRRSSKVRERESGRSPANARARPSPFPIDLNAASAQELEALPRVGPALAKRIVERRQHAGAFQSLDDLRHVRGIGPATLRSFDTLVTFSGRPSPLHSGEPPPPGYHTAYVFGRKSRHYGRSCCTVGESLH